MDEEDGIIVVSAAANGVYLSEDGGSSFENIGVVGDFNFDLAITATEPYVEIISSGFFQPNRYSSETDTWAPLAVSFMEGHLLIGIDAVGDEIYAGIFSNTKIIHSSNGGDTWERLDHNPIASEIRAVAVAPDSDRIYTSIQNSYNFSGDAYNTESISRTTDGGNTWEYIGPLAHGLDLVMHPENAETLFLGTFANGLFRTTDGFDSWENVRAGNKLIPSIAINKISPGEILISEFDFSESTFGIYKSEDGGDSFYKTGDIVATDMVYRNGTDTVYFSHDTGIYMSIDNAESVPTVPAFLLGENVLSLAYGASYLYAGTEEGRLYKIDATGFVEEITGGWNVDKPTAINNILYFGSSLIVGLNGAEQDTLNNLSGGVWQSLDGGGSWFDLSAGLTNNNVFGNTGLAISNEGSLIVATYGQGCFQSVGLILGIAEMEKGNELELSLYPNPSADILFFTSEHTLKSGKILDASGQIIHQLSDQNLDEGKISIRDLSSGAYWLQFSIGNEWKTVPFQKK